MTLHMYMGVTFPLVLQSIMMPLNLKSGALVKVHMLGEPAKGELGRPVTTLSPSPSPSHIMFGLPIEETGGACPVLSYPASSAFSLALKIALCDGIYADVRRSDDSYPWQAVSRRDEPFHQVHRATRSS